MSLPAASDRRVLSATVVVLRVWCTVGPLEGVAGGNTDGEAEDKGLDASVKKELVEEATTAAKGILTYKEREKKRKRIKPSNNPYGYTRSRKLRYAGHKKPVRTSIRVYNVGKMQSMFMSSFLQLPGVREALVASRQLAVQQPEAPREPEVIVIDDGDEPLWPVGVDKVMVSRNPEKIRFPDVGATDMCECAVDCFRDVCVNARTSYYCTAANCRRHDKCSNSLNECKDLELIETKANGTGVRATTAIFAGAFLGNYTGVLTTHDFEADEMQTSEYALKLQQKSSRRKNVYIDATTCGGMTRMMNHSCNASCRFVELRNRRNVVVMVVANRHIKEGEEVTVDYVDPWFECHCGEANCRDRK